MIKKILINCLLSFAFTCMSFAELVTPSDMIYISTFGGAGAVRTGDLSQQGTGFLPIAKGDALAVNAKGHSTGSSFWTIGGQLGYQWPARWLHHISPNWTFSPATELEGYYLGGTTIQGDDLNNATTRITEHYFRVTYPMRTGVFLINARLRANPPKFSKIHPYLGAGIGTAVIAISNANSMQKKPLELGINHYNSGTSDTSTAFAAQPKIGVDYNLSQNTNLFLEYRFLFLSASNYTFGSTVYPNHAATSNWAVKIGSQYYNMGTIGIRYDL